LVLGSRFDTQSARVTDGSPRSPASVVAIAVVVMSKNHH